jgi:hypothetical protein
MNASATVAAGLSHFYPPGMVLEDACIVVSSWGGGILLRGVTPLLLAARCLS